MAAFEERAYGTMAFPVASYPIDYEAGTDFYFFPHYHDALEFFFVHKGDATIWINTIPYHLRTGDFLILPSAAIHAGGPMDADTCGTYVFLCSPDFLCERNNDIIFTEYLRQLTTAGAQALHVTADSPVSGRAAELFRQLTTLFDTKPPAYELLVKARLLELLYLAFSVTDRQSPPPVDPAVSMIKKSLDYIQEHLQDAITLTNLAEQCCLSASQYGRLFKRVMSCTPVTYLLEKRISYAKQLLVNSTLKISDIAIKAGFNNFSYFNRCFRQHQGITPSEYRRQHTQP